MTPGEFLRLIWPSQGLYCIARPYTTPSGIETYTHKVFNTISDAGSFVLAERGSIDIYYPMFSLAAAKVWDPQKIDWKTGKPGAYTTRKHHNMLAAKCFFFDIDVGETKDYHTRDAAMLALKTFVVTAGLPAPSVVSSGSGLHVYWHIDTDLLKADWNSPALQLKQLAEIHGLSVDKTRTTDVASVLRVAGTYNRKDLANIREVKLTKLGAVTPTADFLQMVSDAIIRAGALPKQAKQSAVSGGAFPTQKIEYDGPPVTVGEVAKACPMVVKMLAAKGDLDNNAWYKGMVQTLSFVDRGPDLVRHLTSLHPRDHADVDAKIAQATADGRGPARCETLREVMPWSDAPCLACKFLNDPSVPNPLVAARRTTAAPAPVIELVIPGAPPQVQNIPPPPPPYVRLKSGGIARNSKNADGDEVQDIIYPNDLYPVRRLQNLEHSTEQQVWRVELPRSGVTEFTIDADAVYDVRKFVTAIANQGIYPHKAHIPYLQDYMVAYISQLQRETDAEQQCTHLGWADDYRKFILPDKIIHEDGTIKQAILSTGASRASLHVTKKGSMQKQIELLKFYKDKRYVANQVMVISGLASVIFYMTNQHGIIMNASGEAGASKSTTLYMTAAHWGDPELFPINGTNHGATVKARHERVSTMGNLPVCVDEITHMPPKDAVDLTMSVTQPGHRIRLHTDGTERATSTSYKSTMMLTTANSSLHGLLSMDNTAGTAGSMRVFEMIFKAVGVHEKHEADAMMRELKENFGHIGEAFVLYVIQHRPDIAARVHQVMREIDEAAAIQSSERFWSAAIAVILVAGEIAVSLGLLDYDMAWIREWLLTSQIPFMRGVVLDEYSDPLAILSDYLEFIHGGIVVMVTSGGVGNSTTVNINTPHGPLYAHYDTEARMMYCLKKSFKDYCMKIGANASRIFDELGQPRMNGDGTLSKIITHRSIRRTLGAGTILAKAQSRCFGINMAHASITGAVNLSLIKGDAHRAELSKVALKVVPGD